MPELPEVQTVLDGFVRAIAGKTITEIESYYPGTLILDPEMKTDAFPATLISSERRGKYMICHLSSGHSIIIHLRMTGKLVYDPSPTEPHIHERARILLASGDAIRFIDPRTFGKICLFESQNLPKFMPELGPEPLGKDFNEKYLAIKLKGKKSPIKNILLDQQVVAGFGNIYVCELLFRAGIRPDTPGQILKAKALKNIVKHGKDVLNEAIAVGGTSISDYRRIDDKSGEFQHFLKVYQKEQCPLGHHVENIKLGGRSSFFCPVCQK